MKGKRIITMEIDSIKCDWCGNDILKKEDQYLLTLNNGIEEQIYDICPACWAQLRRKNHLVPVETTKGSSDIVDRLGESDVAYFRRKIREELKEKHKSQFGLAENIGISHGTLWNLLNSTTASLNSKTLEALERYYK